MEPPPPYARTLNYAPIWHEHRPVYNDPHANFERLRGQWTEPPPKTKRKRKETQERDE